MTVTVTGETDPELRVTVIERRLAYEDDPAGFVDEWRPASEALRQRIAAAIALLPQVTITRELLAEVAHTCLAAEVDGHRADIMMVRVARALAAWNDRTTTTEADLAQAARLVLPHRMRRSPLDHLART